MSSAVVSTSAALSRPFIFDAEPALDVCPDLFSVGRPPQPARLEADNLASTDPRRSGITPASRLDVRPSPEMASSGIPAIDALAGGLPRGCLTEICGPASSGRTTLLLAALAAATHRGEFCVVVDASDALDPHSAAAAGVDLDRLLWVRCGESSPQKSRPKETGCPISRAPSAREACPELVERVGISSQAAFKFAQTASRNAEHCLEQLLRATDLLLESGGFGLIALDICDVTPQAARRIPLTTWFRFRRAVEHKPTVLLAFEQHPIAGSCSSLLVKLGHPGDQTLVAQDASAAERRKNAAHACPVPSRRGASRGLADDDEKAPEGRKKICSTAQTTFDLKNPAHTQLLTKLEITARLERSRLERKPARSASIAFASKTAWAG
jgi:hypothetical protein